MLTSLVVFLRSSGPLSSLSPAQDLFLLYPMPDFLCKHHLPLYPQQRWRCLGKPGHSPTLKFYAHKPCLLFLFQIQGMTALPPDIERPYKAEPLVCRTSASSPLHGSFSLRLLECSLLLGSLLSTQCF